MKIIIILALCFIFTEANAQKVTADVYRNRMVKTITGTSISCDSNNIFAKTISTNTIFTFSNMPVAQWITVFITNTGSYTVTWTGVTWSGGSGAAPVQTTGAKTDIWSFIKIGEIIYGAIPSQNYY